MGYALMRPMRRGAVCHITVHWSAEIGLAPLEIHHTIGRVPVGRFTRRIVVNLPGEIPVLRGSSLASPVTYTPLRDKTRRLLVARAHRRDRRSRTALI